MRQIQLFCPTCNAVMPHNQDAPNHVVHGLLTLFTAGLYMPIWIIVAMSKVPPAKCVKCGAAAVETPASAAAEAEARRGRVVMMAIFGLVGLALLAYAGAVAMGWTV